jgi:heat shock protein HtpX
MQAEDAPGGARTSGPFAGVTGVAAGGVADRRVALLMGPVAVYLALLAWLLFGTSGLVPAILVAIGILLLGLRFPVSVAMWLYRAEPLPAAQGTGLREAIASLAERAGIGAPPELAVVPSSAVAVFTVGAAPGAGGKRGRTVLVTEGLLRRRSLAEIAAVLAHEVAHIRAGDIAVFSLADLIGRVAQVFYYIGVALVVVSAGLWAIEETLPPLVPVVMLLLAPTLSSALQFAMSRRHDLSADLFAASLLGDREIVARVAASEPTDRGSLVDDWRLPVPQRRVPLPSVLRVHVDGPDRAARLRAASDLPLMPPLIVRDTPMVSLAGTGPIEMRPRDRWPGLWF